MLRPVIALTAAAVLLAGCASVEPAAPAPPGPSGVTPALSPDPQGRLVGRGLVLDDGSGPEFCLGGVLQSLPPQCSGLPLRGWAWAAGSERASGVTWADAALLGTYDGRRFIVLRSLTPAEVAVQLPAVDELDFASPCPEPSGGWQPKDPARATAADQQRVFAAAERLPGYADAWLDDRGDPGQDPARIVVNVRVIGEPAEAERSLRAVWGGSLCVTRAQRSAAALRRIQTALSHEPGLLSSDSGRGTVEITVVHDDGSLQLQLDERYGPGLVRVTSALRPYQE